MILKKLSLYIHFAFISDVICFWSQVNVFLDVQEFSSHNLFDVTFDNGDLRLELAHFAFNNIQSVPAEVGISADVLRGQVLNLDLAASLARACIDYPALIIILMFSIV